MAWANPDNFGSHPRTFVLQLNIVAGLKKIVYVSLYSWTKNAFIDSVPVPNYSRPCTRLTSTLTLDINRILWIITNVRWQEWHVETPLMHGSQALWDTKISHLGHLILFHSYLILSAVTSSEICSLSGSSYFVLHRRLVGMTARGRHRGFSNKISYGKIIQYRRTWWGLQLNYASIVSCVDITHYVCHDQYTHILDPL